MLGVRFVAISDGVFENERRVFGNVCSDVIYNWCDNSKFCFQDAEEKRSEKERLGLSDKLVLVTVGNCESYKGHDLLIRAIAAMKHKDAIRYLHIGYAAGETEREESLAEELGVTDAIQFLGRTDPKRYLLAADLYVMPSHYEGLSIAALEAIFTGMALLLAEVPGLVEFQNKKLDNIRYFKRTEEALADALDEAVDRYETGAFAPSRAQSDRAKELYDCEGQVAKYTKLYRDMINKRKADQA
jgi:glycosyltransferase involved in cell wall biosynthesis